MTFHEWQQFSLKLHQRARVCRNLILDRMRETAKAAGLSPDIAGLHAHNAMCSYHAGKPWRECNYSLVRKVLWLEQRSFEPDRIADRIITRAWEKIK